MKQSQDVRRLEQSKRTLLGTRRTTQQLSQNNVNNVFQKENGQPTQNQSVHPEGPTVEFYIEKVNGKKSKQQIKKNDQHQRTGVSK